MKLFSFQLDWSSYPESMSNKRLDVVGRSRQALIINIPSSNPISEVSLHRLIGSPFILFNSLKVFIGMFLN